ncbi:MAG: GH3 auxin-responsive promoter family protein, partial [Acidobacteria bacterium]|nr:GH3 auxin-responsive promoter family protein [Acidobacteriota bacterium]
MIETLLKSNSKDAWKFFSECCRNSEITQQKTLLSILKAAAGCQFAEEHDFSHIRTIEDFREKVPLSTWSDYADASMKMQTGESDLLFRGKPTAFILTSGSSGKPKLLPETINGIRAKSATEKLRRHFIFDCAPEVKQGKIFPLANSSKMGTTPSGIPFGAASGLTMMNAPKELLATIAFPLSVFRIDDPDTLNYVMMRFALVEDVRMIIGNNIARMETLVNAAKKYAPEICYDIETGEISSRIKMNDDVRRVLTENIKPNPARADELRRILNREENFVPFAYWPNLKIISGWLSGSVGAPLERV